MRLTANSPPVSPIGEAVVKYSESEEKQGTNMKFIHKGDKCSKVELLQTFETDSTLVESKNMDIDESGNKELESTASHLG